jgi:hypothetical protein
MPNFRANRELLDALADVKAGLHVLMDNLIRANDCTRAEFVAHQMDARLDGIIRAIRVVPGPG